MAPKTFFLIFLVFCSSLFISSAVKTPSRAPTAACDSTLYPRLCRSLLASVKSPAPPSEKYFYEKQILIKTALRLSTLIHRHFRSSEEYFDAGRSDAVALEDCRRLFEMNLDLINSVADDLIRSESAVMISREMVHRVRSRLSAVIANRRTCYEDLVEAKSPIILRGNEVISTAMNRSGRVYSVALGLVTQALSENQAPPPPIISGGGHHGPNHGHHGANHGHHNRSHASPVPPPPPPPPPPTPATPSPTPPPPTPRSSDGGHHRHRASTPPPPPPPPQPTPRRSGGGSEHRDSSPPPRSSGGGTQSASPSNSGATPPASGGKDNTAAAPVPPTTPERRQSLTDLIKGLKKSATCSSSSDTCSKGRLNLLGLQGNGILVGDAVIVTKDDTGDFTTIGDALKSAPENIKPEDGYFVIYAKRGYYGEYISISTHQKNIMLIGDGINKTIITGNRSNADGWGTSNSATFAVAGDRFIAMDVTFRNTYGPGSQAVAVRNQADLSAFYRCSFEGYQDTLYAHSMNQFYRDCHVYGTIDFIFGDASAVFQNSRILGRRPRGGGTVVLTAQSREQPDEPTAMSFHNCTVDAAPDLAALPDRRRRGTAFLGRPWQGFARVVFMESYIGDFINARGWMEWNGQREKDDTVYYGEYRNYGPGAGTSGRVTWHGVKSEMSDSDAASFTVQNLTDGGSWLPDTGIPFTIGLL